MTTRIQKKNPSNIDHWGVKTKFWVSEHLQVAWVVIPETVAVANPCRHLSSFLQSIKGVRINSTQFWHALFTSIFSFLSAARLQGHQPKQENPDLSIHRNVLQFCWGNPKVASWKTWSLLHVLGPPLGLLPSVHAWDTSPGRIQKRCPSHLNNYY